MARVSLESGRGVKLAGEGRAWTGSMPFANLFAAE